MARYNKIVEYRSITFITIDSDMNFEVQRTCVHALTISSLYLCVHRLIFSVKNICIYMSKEVITRLYKKIQKIIPQCTHEQISSRGTYLIICEVKMNYPKICLINVYLCIALPKYYSINVPISKFRRLWINKGKNHRISKVRTIEHNESSPTLHVDRNLIC